VRFLPNHCAKKDYSSLHTDSFGVLVPTRNRVTRLEKLCASIKSSSLQPHQVVIVSSSTEIEATREKELCSDFGFDYVHTSQRGQINQKIIGIKQISPSINYIVFLDDDTLVGKDMFRVLRDFLASNPKCVGVGAWICSESSTPSKRRRNLPGVITKTGFPRSYQWIRTPCEVQWLNGTSMWRSSVVQEYSHNIPGMTWAVFEDVYFSTIARRFGSLWFLPEAKVFLQDSSGEVITRNRMQFMLFANANYVLQFHFSTFRFVFFGYLPFLFLIWKNSSLKSSGSGKLSVLLLFDHVRLSLHLWLDDDPTQYLQKKLVE